MDIGTCACSDLASLFDAEPRADKFAQLIDVPPGSFRCEFEPVSARSIGSPVRDNKTLIRVVVSPRDMDKNVPTTIGENCVLDVARSGMSVLRATDSPAEIIKMAKALVERQSANIPEDQEAVCVGVIEFECLDARRFLYNNNRALGVYELPEVEYPSHAEVFIAVSLIGSINRSKNEARNFLETIRSKFIPASEYSRADLAGISRVGKIPLE